MAFLKRFYLLLFIGIITSLYLVFHHVEVVGGYTNEPSFCNINASFDCDSVAKSKYSSFLGVPVASYGLFYYLFSAFILYLIARKEGAEKNIDVVVFLSSLSLPFSIGLLLISKFLIGKLCIVCCLIYLINFILFAISVSNPDRNKGIINSFISGFLIILKLFSSLNVAAVLAYVGGFVLLAFCYFLPINLEYEYFIPRMKELNSDKFLKPMINEWANSKEFDIPLYLESSPLRDYILGSLDAPYTLVEFSDYECPMCKKAAPIIKSFIEQSGGEVRFINRMYPLSSKCNQNMTTDKHEYACTASEAVRCAGEQGESFYWKYHEQVLASISLSDQSFISIADGLQLNREQFEGCLASGRGKAKIKKDVEIATTLMVDSTPTFILNGKLLKIRADLIPFVINKIIQIEKNLGEKEK